MRIPVQINSGDCAAYAQYLEIEHGKEVEFYKIYYRTQSDTIKGLEKLLRESRQEVLIVRDETLFYRKRNGSLDKTLDESIRQTKAERDKSEKFEEDLRVERLYSATLRNENEDLKQALKYRKAHRKAS